MTAPVTGKKSKAEPLISAYLWIALLVFLIALPAEYFLKKGANLLYGPSAEGLPIYGTVPDFTLTERSGKKFGAADLKGKVWIADFIFTRCAGACPLMSTRMSKLRSRLAGEPELRFVSFSVDPEHDTPEVLSAYAEKFKADPEKWLFLTGERAALYRLSEQHFHLGVQEIPAAALTPDGRVRRRRDQGESRPAAGRELDTQSVSHSSKFALVDREGRIRGYYDGDSLPGPEADPLARLLRDARALVRAGATGRPREEQRLVNKNGF